MSPADRDVLWKAALGELKSWTQMIASLPDKDVVKDFATRAVRKVVYGDSGAHEEAPKIAAEIADWICEHFDPAKRKRPKTSRIDRDARYKLIADAFLQAQALGEHLSTRALSKAFNCSPATVCRALKIKQVSHSDDFNTVLDNVVEAKRLLEKILPRDGIRAIYTEVLAQQIGVGTHLIWPRLSAVSKRYPGWYFHALGSEVIISRGRRLRQDQICKWRKKARSTSVVNPKRQLHDFGRSVWSDLLTVVAVLSGNASSDDWRAFLNIITLKPFEWLAIQRYQSEFPVYLDHYTTAKIVCADPNFMANRVQSAFNAGMDYCQIRSIERYNQPFRRDAEVLREILYLVEVTRDYELGDAIDAWLSVSCYQLRVQLGMLPGCHVEDLKSFRLAACDYDNDHGHLRDLLERRIS